MIFYFVQGDAVWTSGAEAVSTIVPQHVSLVTTVHRTVGNVAVRRTTVIVSLVSRRIME